MALERAKAFELRREQLSGLNPQFYNNSMALLLEKGEQVEYASSGSYYSPVPGEGQGGELEHHDFSHSFTHVEVRAEDLPCGDGSQISFLLSFSGEMDWMRKHPKSVEADPFLELRDKTSIMEFKLFIQSNLVDTRIPTSPSSRGTPVCLFGFNMHDGNHLTIFGKELYDNNDYSPFVSQESIDEFSDVVELLKWLRANSQYLPSTS